MRKKEASKIKKNFTQIISTRGHGSSHVHSLIANFSKKKKTFSGSRTKYAYTVSPKCYKRWEELKFWAYYKNAKFTWDQSD